MKSLTVAVPNPGMLARISAATDDVDLVVWVAGDEPLGRAIDLLVMPYMGSAAALAKLEGVAVSVVQSQSLGYDGVADVLPAGLTFCNAVGVHEGSTAELTLGLILSAQRGFYESAAHQRAAEWVRDEYRGLGGRSVMIIGVGGVGSEIEKRLIPFGVEITRVARTARDDERGHIHAMTELHDILPTAEIVVIAVPLSDETTHLVDAAFLDRMQPGGLLVNISRGAVVDTEALVARLSTGAVRAALDVTDPEPLPNGHPLWSMPGTIITPHLGGHSKTMPNRIDPVVLDQIARLQNGLAPANAVVGP